MDTFVMSLHRIEHSTGVTRLISVASYDYPVIGGTSIITIA